MGRPKKQAQLTEAQVFELASIGCSDEEIACLCGVSEMTLRRRFDTVLKKGRSDLRKRLRKKQIDRALNGSDMMLLWLGKQLLGQRDKIENQGEQTQQVVIVLPAEEPAPVAPDRAEPGSAD